MPAIIVDIVMFKMLKKIGKTCAIVAIGLLCASGLSAAENVALGKAVTMVPPPDGAKGAKAKQIAKSLTDGKHSGAKNDWLWRDREAAATWRYAGPISIAVDLERPCHISEIGIRLMGGSYEWGGQGKSFPVRVEVFVSDEGEDYVKVDEFSRWNEGDFEKFGVPSDEGKAWVHDLRFTNLDLTGRWVGLRIYGNGMASADEITVLGSAETGGKAGVAGKADVTLSDFTVKTPYFYFHKPVIQLATNVTLPVPFGLRLPEASGRDQLKLTFDVPAGVTLRGGYVGGVKLDSLDAEVLENGDHRYALEVAGRLASRKEFGRLFLEASGWEDGQKGALVWRYQGADGWQSPEMVTPLEAVTVPEAPRLKKIMTGLGWWYQWQTVAWPDALESFRTIGLNTVPFVTSKSAPLGPEPGTLEMKLLEEARKQGFKISLVDYTIGRMMVRHGDAAEVYCQYGDGGTSDAFCPSYRGLYWQEEIERFARLMGTVRPDFLSQDIELWHAADWADFDFSHKDVDTRVCVRCKADFDASGLKSGDAWKVQKGLEMWGALMTAAREAVVAAGGDAGFRASGYNFRPGQTYQTVWNFNQLHGQGLIDHSQVSTYSSLYPYHIGWIGDRVRKDKERVEGGSVMPWLTPGDAGMFPAEAFQWSLLEAFANGADGIWFWSNRMWDAESLIAYNKVIRAIAPVEAVITDGELLAQTASVKGIGRVSGMKSGNDMVLLVADYEGRSNGVVVIEVDLPAAAQVRDLLTGEIVFEHSPAGKQTLEVDLNGERARLLAVRGA